MSGEDTNRDPVHVPCPHHAHVVVATIQVGSYHLPDGVHVIEHLSAQQRDFFQDAVELMRRDKAELGGP